MGAANEALKQSLQMAMHSLLDERGALARHPVFDMDPADMGEADREIKAENEAQQAELTEAMRQLLPALRAAGDDQEWGIG